MTARLLPSRSLIVAVALLMAGNGLVSIFLSLRMSLEAVAVPLIGLVMSAYFVGLMAGAFLGGGVIRQVGHIRAFAAFASVATAAVLAHGLWFAPGFWALLRALTGLGIAGLYVVIESWLNAHATNVTRGRLFSLYMVVSTLALGLGQFLLNLTDVATLEALLLAAMLFALCALPVSLTRAAHPHIPEHAPFGVGALARSAPLALTGALCSGLAGGAFIALGPVYADQSGLGVGGASLLMGTTMLGGLVLQWPVGHLSDRMDRRRVLSIVALLLSLLSLIIAYIGPHPLPPLLTLAAVYGGLSYTLYPLSVSHANDHLEHRHFVAASGTLLLVWGIGAALGPSLASFVMGPAGPEGLFYTTAAVGAALGIIGGVMRRVSVPTAEQTTFVSLAKTTPTIAEMDPRAEEEGTGKAGAES